MRISTLVILFFVLVASICVPQAVEPNLLWTYTEADAGIGLADVAISADGEYIAAGSCRGMEGGWTKQFEPMGVIYFFNRNGELLWSYKTDTRSEGISVSADGRYVVNGYGEIYFIDSQVITTPSTIATTEYSTPIPESSSYEVVFAIGDY